MKFSSWVIATILLLSSVSVATFAQWAPPTGAPAFSNNVLAPINVGNSTQTKNGSLGILNGIFAVDSNLPASNPQWVMPSITSYAIDTDGPVSSHGVFSSSNIQTMNSLFANSFKVDPTSPNYPTTPDLQPLCAQKTDGKFVPCAGGANGGLTASITLNKTTCTGSACDDIDISWTSNANACQVLSGGPQFVTGGLATGNDNDNIALQTTTYTIYCTGATGGSVTASATLTVTNTARVVMQMRKTAPLPITDWTINYANATGSTPFNSCYRNGYLHQNSNQPPVGNKETLTGSQLNILVSDNIDKTQYCEIEDGLSWTPNCTDSGLSWGIRMKATAGTVTHLSNMFASGGTNTTCMRVKCKTTSGSWVYSDKYMHRNGAYGVSGCGPIN